MSSVTLPDLLCSFDGECPGIAPGVTLAELASTQAAWFRSWGTEAGDLFAAHMASLAADITACSNPGEAISVQEFQSRVDALHLDCSRPEFDYTEEF